MPSHTDKANQGIEKELEEKRREREIREDAHEREKKEKKKKDIYKERRRLHAGTGSHRTFL